MQTGRVTCTLGNNCMQTGRVNARWVTIAFNGSIVTPQCTN